MCSVQFSCTVVGRQDNCEVWEFGSTFTCNVVSIKGMCIAVDILQYKVVDLGGGNFALISKVFRTFIFS